MNSAPVVAVIGGTGMNQWPGLEIEARRGFATPYGEPSAPLLIGCVYGVRAAFLARHGEGHKIPPHKINYRANMWALREAGVRDVIAIAAVGGIAPWLPPGGVAATSDLIDYTCDREHTYSDGAPGSELHHVEVGEIYSARLRSALREGAAAGQVAMEDRGILGVTQGPRLETPAEVQRMRRDGCDMVGMTGMPEAALAAELGLSYACLALSVNWAAGLGSGGIHDEIQQSIEAGMAKVRAILQHALPKLASAGGAG